MKVLKARLYDLKQKEQQAKLEQIGGAKKDIAFGSQIRSYVLQPYQMIKDHRTKYQVGDVQRVLDGDIDQFIKTYLMQKASGTLGTAHATDDDVVGRTERSASVRVRGRVAAACPEMNASLIASAASATGSPVVAIHGHEDDVARRLELRRVLRGRRAARCRSA